jgi:hypothetical protein
MLFTVSAPLVNDHFGEHPVIYMEFGDVISTDPSTFLSEFQSALKRTFKNFEFIYGCHFQSSCLNSKFVDDFLKREEEKSLGRKEKEQLAYMRDVFGKKAMEETELRDGLVNLMEILQHRCS